MEIEMEMIWKRLVTDPLVDRQTLLHLHVFLKISLFKLLKKCTQIHVIIVKIRIQKSYHLQSPLHEMGFSETPRGALPPAPGPPCSAPAPRPGSVRGHSPAPGPPCPAQNLFIIL